MSRQRVFVPGFWSSMKIKRLIREHGAEAALFYWGLNSHADDEGRGYTDIDWLEMKMPILKISQELVTNWLKTSNELGLIKLYGDTENDINRYYLIPDWFEKQKIPKPYRSEIPLPNDISFNDCTNYFLSLKNQLEQIIQRFEKEGKITNQLETSLELVINQLGTGSTMKLKEVKGKEKKRSKQLNNVELDVQQSAFFEVFWKLWPVKINKHTAIKSWQKLKVDENLFNIIISKVAEAIDSQQWAPNKDGKKFIPHASTWLNNRRWEDEYTPIKKNGDKYDF